MYKDITGIILSGGKSSRMGQNKSQLELDGKTVIERLVDLLKSLFQNVILITNETDEYKKLNIEKYSDIYPYMGPLSGIHSGLVNSISRRNFIISCDIPLINKETIEFLCNYNSTNSIIVPKAGGFIQQLCGVYNKDCINIIENILKSNTETETRDKIQGKRKCKVHELLKIVNTEIIDIENIYPGYDPDLFFNMNSPEDYEYVKTKIV